MKPRKEREKQRTSGHTNLIISLLARLRQGHADLHTVLQPNVRVSSLLDPPAVKGFLSFSPLAVIYVPPDVTTSKLCEDLMTGNSVRCCA